MLNLKRKKKTSRTKTELKCLFLSILDEPIQEEKRTLVIAKVSAILLRA